MTGYILIVWREGEGLTLQAPQGFVIDMAVVKEVGVAVKTGLEFSLLLLFILQLAIGTCGGKWAGDAYSRSRFKCIVLQVVPEECEVRYYVIKVIIMHNINIVCVHVHCTLVHDVQCVENQTTPF